jgi:hypothetical protein
MDSAPATGQAVDGLGVQRLGLVIGGEQGAGAGEQAERQR